MNLKEGGIYSCGKKIYRKILRIDGDHVVYAKCYYTSHRGMHVIGGGTHFTNRILSNSFKGWINKGNGDWDDLKCSCCSVVLVGEQTNTAQLCKECYEL